MSDPTEEKSGPRPSIGEVLPRKGILYCKKGELRQVLCKPKIMPIKSMTLEKIEEMEKARRKALEAEEEQTQQQQQQQQQASS